MLFCLPANVFNSEFLPIYGIRILKIAQSSRLAQPVNLRCLLILPWCTAITGYHTISGNGNNQQQLMVGYRQKSKSLPGAMQPTRVKTTTNKIYAWQFKYANTIPTVVCTNNGLICGYITGIHDKRIVISVVTKNLPHFIRMISLYTYTLAFMSQANYTMCSQELEALCTNRMDIWLQI